MDNEYGLQLQNIAGGALQELFANDLEKVLANIDDKNTSAKKVRKLIIELKLVPADESREIILADIRTKTLLAPIEGVTTKIMLDKNGNKIVAAEFGERMKGQMSLLEPKDENNAENKEKTKKENNFENNNVRQLFKAK